MPEIPTDLTTQEASAARILTRVIDLIQQDLGIQDSFALIRRPRAQPPTTITCIYCGSPLTPHRKRQRFCSTDCRNRFHNQT